MEKQLSPFAQKVIATVQKIPKGKVASYKQIAELCGKPHASRGVAWILNSCAKKYGLPWQRVLSSRGRISFKSGTRNFLLQKTRLRAEGVQFGSNDDIDMARFQWKKRVRRHPRRRTQPRLFGDL
ncbi:MAG: MGMT family protein [Bdellovibrionales bacterium]